jgi:hypothetical protein
VDERVACQACGGWVFHLAKACPRCGAPVGAPRPAPVPPPPPAPRPPPLTLSPEEARALLQVTTGGARPAGLAGVAAELVWPRGGWVELVLSALAAPVTASTVLVLGWLLLRERPGARDSKLQGLRGLAVPACTALVAASLAGGGLPWLAWALLLASFLAWALREAWRRARAPPRSELE